MANLGTKVINPAAVLEMGRPRRAGGPLGGWWDQPCLTIAGKRKPPTFALLCRTNRPRKFGHFTKGSTEMRACAKGITVANSFTIIADHSLPPFFRSPSLADSNGPTHLFSGWFIQMSSRSKCYSIFRPPLFRPHFPFLFPP